MTLSATRKSTSTITRAGSNHENIGVATMMALTFVTGLVDAVGYLGLDRVFTGNMTGNIVILGMAVAGADELPVLGPVIALIAFTFGACVSGLALRSSPKGWHTRTTTLFATGGLVLLALAITMFVVGDNMSKIQQVAFAAVIALVMGEQAAVARALAVKDMTTVVVTSTLTSLASESFFGSGSAWWNRRVGAVVTIFVGAIIGALLLLVHVALALLIGAVITLGVTFIGHRYLTHDIRVRSSENQG
ncbi:YoaK family protein [Rhodococcus sp. IEGM 1379]|uniref:YoaK family protein n=1 Tax=Rhodococcus sp. IEGM 1379 TaxID=3047086 RepID=UPI0024B6767D|nr:YoaK family protein [Rhodococcus sp. IEGM 1379]MDI9915965.1 YoaK family protein [Rhodococcus sp. IEGM 1379]